MNISLPNGTILSGVPEGTSDVEIMKFAIKGGHATVQDFGYDPTASDDFPVYTPNDEEFFVGDMLKLQQEREQQVQQEQLEAQREILKKTVEEPTFMEEAHLAFDQGSSLMEDFNTVLTAAFPQSTVTYSFEEGSLLPTLQMGLGDEFQSLSYDERLQRLRENKAANVAEEHADTLTKQEVWGRSTGANVAGTLTKGLLDPSVLLPVGQSTKAMLAIGGGVGLASGLASQAAQNEFDAANLVGYTVLGATLPVAVTRAGQVLKEAPSAIATSKEKLENAGRSIINMADRRTPGQKSADAANNTLTAMEEEAARLVSKGIPEDKVLPLVQANLGYDTAKVTRTLADADRPFVVPTKEEAFEIVRQLENPIYTKSWLAQKVDPILAPISSRIGKLSKPLMVSLREVDRKTLQRIGDASREFQDFFNVGMKKVKEGNPNWASLENALMNNNFARAEQIATEHFPEVVETLPKIRSTLDGLFKELEEAGVDVKYLDDFFPRSVKDREGLMMAIGSKTKSYISQALESERARLAKAKENDQYELTLAQKDDIINKVLMGYRPTPKGLKRLTSSRKIPYLEENLQRFYHSAPESLQMYLNKSIREIEKRKFFGKNGVKKEGSEDLDYRNSAGSLIRELTEDLPQKQVDELTDLINARFEGEDLKMNDTIAKGRDLQYIALLAQLDSALVQLGDVGSAVYLNGFKNTFASFMGKKQLTAEELGVIDNVAAEMNSGGGFSKAMDTTLRLSGFKFMDKVGKNALINSSLRKYRQMSATPEGRRKLEKQWGDVFGGDISKLTQELQSGKITDRVKTLVWNDLTDVQPVTLTEMPEGYLKNPNGRIFYSLKSYMIKQLDLVRNRSVAKMQSKDKETRLEGLRDLARYVGTVGLGNAAVGTVRDYYLSGGDSRALTPSNYTDNFINTLMATTFLNRYLVDRYISEGKLGEAISATFTPPALNVIDDVGTALVEVAKTKSLDNDEVERALKNVGVIGKLYYTFLGGGMEKRQERIDEEEAKSKVLTGL